MIQDKRPGQGGGKPPKAGPPLSTSSVSTGQSDRTATSGDEGTTKTGQDQDKPEVKEYENMTLEERERVLGEVCRSMITPGFRSAVRQAQDKRPVHVTKIVAMAKRNLSAAGCRTEDRIAQIYVELLIELGEQEAADEVYAYYEGS